ncbi:MAG: hypothetical protein KDA86_08920 [Planctomycetaceae bacterium]|nr:hypothetical protein [Planctomycetaceae bacterium]
MNRLTIDHVTRLFGRRPGWCVSLYMPTHWAGKEIREEPIRLKNLVGDADEQLQAVGVAGRDIKRLLEPARRLCNLDAESNREFWRHQYGGLVLLLSTDGEEHFRFPEVFEEQVVVDHRFHVKPLLKALQQDEQYCVLAVSQGGVRFLEGCRSGLSERSLEDMPDNFQSVVRGDHHKGFNLHSFRVRSNTGDTAVPHGHVESNEEHELRRYFREIAAAISDALKEDQRPLLFAGVAELFPYFREEVEYSHLNEQPLTGNPDDLSDEELHRQAWPIVASLIDERRLQILDRWKHAAQTDLGDDALEDIIVAANEGRVETLLLASDSHTWGVYEPETRKVQRAKEASAENYDLCDLAAVETLNTGGQVMIFDDQTLGDDDVAAIYRYAV